MLLFITDRCPVGCHHCSVDSRPDSPMIADFELFAVILDWMCANQALSIIGISGGEPFVERRGLTLAIRRFAAAGKRLVVFTSGVWAAADVPRWVREHLALLDCVYLSTDGFHARTITDQCFVRAARAIADAGPWIVVQVVDTDGDSRARAERLLASALGERWDERAEVNVIAPLANGRGADTFKLTARAKGHTYGPCSLVRSPMIRYDGTLLGCCNEDVIMGHGPSRLRRQARTAQDIEQIVDGFHRDPLLRVIGDTGLGVLSEHGRFSDLAHRRFSNNCELCWTILDRMPEGTDSLLNAIAALGVENNHHENPR